jgi:hypothetical protein
LPASASRSRIVAGLSCLFVALALSAACGGGGNDKATAVLTGATTGAAGPTSTAKPTTGATGAGGDVTASLPDNGQGIACPLLSTAEVSDITGVAMRDGVGQGGEGPYDDCVWDAQQGTASITLDVYKTEGSEYYGIAATDNVAVPALGDKAQWGTGLARLEVLKGHVYFVTFAVVRLGPTADDANLAAAKALAAKVVERLP